MQTVCAAISTPRTIVGRNARGSGSTVSRRSDSSASTRNPAHTERTVAAVITFTPFANASRAETWPAPSETATPKSAKTSSQVLGRADMGARAKARDYARSWRRCRHRPLAPAARPVDNARAMKLADALAAIALLFACIATPGAADEARERLIAEVARAANGFLATLPDDRRLAAKAAFQSGDRTTWRYTPGSRPGMPMQEMSPAQRDAVHALLRSFLSADGYLKVQSIMALEAVLRELE